MRGGYFRQMRIGSQASLLDFRQLFRGQNIVQIFGNEVRIELRTGAGRQGRGQPASTGNLLDPGNQFLSGIALRHLLADQSRLGRLERIIKIGQQSSQSQSHGNSPLYGTRDTTPLPVIVEIALRFRTRFLSFPAKFPE